jgi:RNA polymerase sigma factor (sigma-70 family)
MAELTDHELLTRFARNGDEAAFATLVTRHVNLVWSAARRFTGDDTLASEVTQAVFIILAQKAGRLSAQTVLTGWLYQTARLTAANALKENRRRQQREHQAYMESTLTPNETNEAWQQLAPVLDEAMHALRTADRDAVLLRFFENKTLADVGAALGVTEDAARVRVNRALDKLRALLAKQGIKFGATAIAGAVAANAVSAAPATLAASITTAVLTGTSLTLATIAMTTLQKIAVTAALTVTIGSGLFAAKQAHDAQNAVRTLQAQQAPLAEQIQQLQAERDKAMNRLAGMADELAQAKNNELELLKLRGELTVLKTAASDSVETGAKKWLENVNKLKRRLEETPAAKIPEMQFLTEENWMDAGRFKLNTDTDYRHALACVRNYSEGKFGSMLLEALQKYSQANSNQFPTDLTQLQPYFDTPVDDTILQRWEIKPAKSVSTGLNVNVGDTIITQKAAVDDVFDARTVVGSLGYASANFLDTNSILVPLYQAFMSANNGQDATDKIQLLPYATTPEQKALLQKVLLFDSVSK